MMPAIAPDQLLQAALDYARLGWPVIPLHSVVNDWCSCGDPECKSPAKHPLTEHGTHDATTDAAIIRAWWQRWPWANIGVVGADVFFLDIDVKKGKRGDVILEQLTAEHSALPDTALQYTASGGQHYVFRQPTGRKIGNRTNALGNGIDIRGHNGYIVVEPSIAIDPRNGQTAPYEWEASSSPLDDQAIADAPAWLLQLLQQPEAKITAPGTMQRLLSPAEMAEIKSALNYIPADDYDTWIRVGLILHSTGAGQQAFGLWCDWASMCDEKYSQQVQAVKWKTFKNDKGFDNAELASLFAMAQGYGWLNPRSQQATEFDELMRQAQRQQQYNLKPEPQHQINPFPVDSLNQLAAWIAEQSAASWAQADQHAALAVASIAASRLYVSENGDPCHLYLGLLGHSVGELRYTHRAIQRIMMDAGLRRMMRAHRFTSSQTLYKTLQRSPSCLYLADDYGQILAFARRQPSGLQEQMLTALAQIYAQDEIQIDSPEDAGLKAGMAGDEQPMIYRPGLTTLALLSEDQLAAVVRRGELGRGALEQLLINRVEGRPDLHPPSRSKTPSWAVHHIRKIRKLPSDISGHDIDLPTIFNGGAGLLPEQTIVPIGDNVAELLRQTDTEFLAHGEQTISLRPLALEACNTIRRIATALAAWNDPDCPVITSSIAQWACQYVMTLFDQFINQFQMLSNDDGKLTDYDKVQEVIAGQGRTGISHRDLTRMCWTFRNMTQEKREALITGMIADEVIVEIKKGKKRLYISKTFIHDSNNE